MINFVLYALLGVALSVAGVSVMEKPWQTIVIIAIVLAIDYAGRLR